MMAQRRKTEAAMGFLTKSVHVEALKHETPEECALVAKSVAYGLTENSELVDRLNTWSEIWIKWTGEGLDWSHTEPDKFQKTHIGAIDIADPPERHPSEYMKYLPRAWDLKITLMNGNGFGLASSPKPFDDVSPHTHVSVSELHSKSFQISSRAGVGNLDVAQV